MAQPTQTLPPPPAKRQRRAQLPAIMRLSDELLLSIFGGVIWFDNSDESPLAGIVSAMRRRGELTPEGRRLYAYFPTTPSDVLYYLRVAPLRRVCRRFAGLIEARRTDHGRMLHRLRESYLRCSRPLAVMDMADEFDAKNAHLPKSTLRAARLALRVAYHTNIPLRLAMVYDDLTWEANCVSSDEEETDEDDGMDADE